MKKKIAIILTTAIMLGMTACASTPEQTDVNESAPAETSAVTQEATAETTAADPGTGMPNPWTEVDTATAAAEGAGVSFFVVPSEGTDTDAGPVHWDLFQYMDGIAEAQGSLGTASLTIRKGAGTDNEDISGDYNDYAYEWQLEADGWLVNCRGNEDGQAMLITWVTDNNAYCIIIRGQGDLYDTYGIDEYMVDTLVSGIQ